MGELKIPLHDLDTQGKDFVFALDASWLNQALAGTGVAGDGSAEVGAVQVHAQRNGTEILVHGSARARLVAECVRCLKGLPVDVSCELAALYAPRTGAPGEDEDTDEDLDVDPDEPDREFYTGDQLVIDELVRDYLLLELPMQPRCELGWQCPNLDVPEHMRAPDGISNSKGFGERGPDPRLAPLQKLVRKGESDKE
jgi:uncharacterized metal-binding protein YceD (DUF177 family)